MRVITFNANGIRAAANKGFFTWLTQQHADIVGIQEIKAPYTRQPPQEVVRKLGESTLDKEGRYLEARFSTINIVSWVVLYK